MQFVMLIFFVLNSLMLFGNVKGSEIRQGIFFFFLGGGEGWLIFWSRDFSIIPVLMSYHEPQCSIQVASDRVKFDHDIRHYSHLLNASLFRHER